MTVKSFVLTTLGGDVAVEYLNNCGSPVKVLMGKVIYESSKIPVSGADRLAINETMTFNGQEYKATCLSIGNQKSRQHT